MKLFKKTIFVIIILLGSNSIQSQKIELKDLQNLNKLSMNDFNKQVTEVYKYTYVDKKESRYANSYLYANPDSIRVIVKLEITLLPEESSVEYWTKDKVEFEKFETNLENLGYKFVDFGDLERENFVTIKKGKQTIILYTPDKVGEFYRIHVQQ